MPSACSVEFFSSLLICSVKPMQQHKPHSFTPARFSVPTWCTHCNCFVKNPFGVQGYHCERCNSQIHKDCLNAAAATPCIVGGTRKENMLTFRSHVLKAHSAPITTKKMNGFFAQLTQKAVTLNLTGSTCTLGAINPLSILLSFVAMTWEILSKLVVDLQTYSSQHPQKKISKGVFMKQILPKYITTGQQELVEDYWWDLCKGKGIGNCIVNHSLFLD